MHLFILTFLDFKDELHIFVGQYLRSCFAAMSMFSMLWYGSSILFLATLPDKNRVAVNYPRRRIAVTMQECLCCKQVSSNLI